MYSQHTTEYDKMWIQLSDSGNQVLSEGDRIDPMLSHPVNHGGLGRAPAFIPANAGNYGNDLLFSAVGGMFDETEQSINPAYLTMRNEALGADNSVLSANHLDNGQPSSMGPGDDRSRHDQMNLEMYLRPNASWPAELGHTQPFVQEHGNDFQRYDTQSGPSAYANSHGGNRSIFSAPMLRTNTTNTTNEFGYPPNNMPENSRASETLRQNGSGIEHTPNSRGGRSYAAVVSGDSPYQSQPSTFPQHLSVPGQHASRPSMPPTSPSAQTDTASEVPEVLLCLKDGCPQTFLGKYRLGNRGRHMRTKHGSNTYDCHVCGKPYKRSDARLKHLRKAHPGSAAEPVGRRQNATMASQ